MPNKQFEKLLQSLKGIICSQYVYKYYNSIENIK